MPSQLSADEQDDKADDAGRKERKKQGKRVLTPGYLCICSRPSCPCLNT